MSDNSLNFFLLTYFFTRMKNIYKTWRIMKHLPVPLEPCYTILPMLTLFNWLWKNQRNLQFIRLQWKSLAKDRKGYFLIGKIVKELEVLFQVTSLFRSEIRSNNLYLLCTLLILVIMSRYIKQFLLDVPLGGFHKWRHLQNVLTFLV